MVFLLLLMFLLQFHHNLDRYETLVIHASLIGPLTMVYIIFLSEKTIEVVWLDVLNFFSCCLACQQVLWLVSKQTMNGGPTKLSCRQLEICSLWQKGFASDGDSDSDHVLQIKNCALVFWILWIQNTIRITGICLYCELPATRQGTLDEPYP